VTAKDDMTRALEEGRTAAVGAENPYAGKSLALAKIWRRGYQAMLTRTWYTSPHRREYLQARGTQRD
jgi:hypothetical protein